jgi:hypothetical protein
LLKEVGLDIEVPQTCFRTAFLKALQDVRKRAHKQHLLIRKIYKKPNEYCFGLVDESVNVEEIDLTYFQSATLKFNPLTGDLACDHAHRAFDLIREKYSEYKDMLDSDDVRLLVSSVLLTNHRVSVRKRGGIYFLPASKKALVDQLTALLEKVNTQCSMEVAPQVGFEKTKAAIYKSFMNELKLEIATYRDELNSGVGRKSKWQARLEEFKALRDKVTFYAEALKFQGDTLLDQIDTLKNDVAARLAE